MPAMELVDGTAEKLDTLTFLRTVDRTLLHRTALSEVFLTDSAELDGSSYVAAAQLPASHAHYGDHVGHRAVDPMLLLECARQAETYGGHVHMGVDRDSKFVLKSWSLRLPGLFEALGNGRAAELGMAVITDRVPGRPVRALTYQVALSTADGQVGDVRIDVGYLSSAAYSHVRTLRRGSEPPTSDHVPTAPSHVPPSLVGRTSMANVVLRDLVDTGHAVTATIRPVMDNPSFFDHAQDHVPGMVLTEAARQICLVASGSPETTVMTGFDLDFAKYAELDAVVRVAARPTPVAGTFAVSFRQHDEVIADGEVTTAVVPASHRAVIA